MDAAQEIGLPDGVSNLIPGYAPTAGRRSLHTRMWTWFRSPARAGRNACRRTRQRGRQKVVLELAGKSANVILPGADLGRPVKVSVANCFLNAGQTCAAETLTRMLVHAPQYEQAVVLAATAAAKYTTGYPVDPATGSCSPAFAGPAGAGARVHRGRLKPGRTPGAGGSEASHEWIRRRPTVFADVTPDMTVATEEIFGLGLCILAC
jgi:aldehyde dehydrogenase (NAD+)